MIIKLPCGCRAVWMLVTIDGQPVYKIADNQQHRAECQVGPLGRFLATDTWVKIIRHDPCAYCGRSGGTVDHIVPLSEGGLNTWENYSGACGRCNLKKASTPLLKFLLKAQ